ncbi:integrase catalytic domain-containing protein [Trichonephila clavipes]|nr:integrase catalytic domain-containing protein [Trichonephila clavipes]
MLPHFWDVNDRSLPDPLHDEVIFLYIYQIGLNNRIQGSINQEVSWKRYVESVSNTAIQDSVENQPQNITLPLNSTVSSILTNQPRLPKLTLESFSGKDISSFPSFWARFKSAVYENSSLNDVDKFSYLKSVVTSDAELAIRALTLTSENYAKAMKILENRFERKELIVDSYSCLLFPIIMKAIPSDLALEYNKKHNETQSQITDLIAYLRSEVESRERTEFLVKPHDLELKNNNSYSNTKYFERTSHSYPQSNRRVQEKSKQNSHLDLEEKNVDVKTTSSNSVFHNRGGVLLQCVKAEIIGLLHQIRYFAFLIMEGKCDERSDCTLVHLVHSEEESISTDLRRFWEIESLGILDKGSVTLGNGDEEILSEFDESVYFVDGRYRVNLPWKPGMREALQNNKTVARKRFEGLVRRFKCDHELFCEYKDVIDDYVREGIVERTSCDSL